MWIFDATPLIYLAKVDSLAYVDELDDARVIPERVYGEVVETGIEQSYPDARRIERSVDDGRFDVVAVDETPVFERLRRNPNLSDADVAVLAHAAAVDGIGVMDETHGRDVAATEQITTRGTAYVVLLLASRGAISVETARSVIDGMVDSGWYCGTATYAKLVQRLESLQNEV